MDPGEIQRRGCPAEPYDRIVQLVVSAWIFALRSYAKSLPVGMDVIEFRLEGSFTGLKPARDLEKAVVMHRFGFGKVDVAFFQDLIVDDDLDEIAAGRFSAKRSFRKDLLCKHLPGGKIIARKNHAANIPSPACRRLKSASLEKLRIWEDRDLPTGSSRVDRHYQVQTRINCTAKLPEGSCSFGILRRSAAFCV